MATPRPPHSTVPLTQQEPPGPAFRLCACGALVQYRTWHHGTKEQPAWWEYLPRPVTPVLGYKHHCATQEPREGGKEAFAGVDEKEQRHAS